MIKDNIIVGYFNGKAIAVDEDDNLLYAEMPEEFVHMGEILEGGRYISELSGREINEIYNYLSEEA